MPKPIPIRLIMHYPKSDSGREALAIQVAQVHADAVLTRIRQLNCPDAQKLQLLDAVIADVKKRCAHPG